MANRNGTVFGVCALPWPWPPKHAITIIRLPSQDQSIEVQALPSGKLAARVSDANGAVFVSVRTQRISLENAGLCVLTCTWEPGIVQVRIDDVQLLTDAPGIRTRSFKMAAKGSPIGPFSVDHPDAFLNCYKWIQNRKRKFATPKLSSNPGRRPINNNQQGQDLQESIEQLNKTRMEVTRGDLSRMGILATQLRAMVFWKSDDSHDRGYNPLLLRMASKADLPLPVYVIGGHPPLMSDPDSLLDLNTNAARIRSHFETDELVDIQEWLSFVAMRLPKSAGEITVKGIISELANTSGIAHSSEDSSEFIETLNDIIALNLNPLAGFLIDAAKVTLLLSEWVLSELVSRGVLT